MLKVPDLNFHGQLAALETLPLTQYRINWVRPWVASLPSLRPAPSALLPLRGRGVLLPSGSCTTSAHRLLGEAGSPWLCPSLL